MAAPDRLNWINQAVTEVAKVLRASAHFMKAGGEGAPAGATGVVTRVDEYDVAVGVLPKHGIIYCAVGYGGHQRAADDDSAGQTDYTIDVTIDLVAKTILGPQGDERRRLLKLVQRAGSVVPYIVTREIGPPDGAGANGQFGGFAELAWPMGGRLIQTLNPIDEDGKPARQEFLATLATGIRLQVTLVDT